MPGFYFRQYTCSKGRHIYYVIILHFRRIKFSPTQAIGKIGEIFILMKNTRCTVCDYMGYPHQRKKLVLKALGGGATMLKGVWREHCVVCTLYMIGFRICLNLNTQVQAIAMGS